MLLNRVELIVAKGLSMVVDRLLLLVGNMFGLIGCLQTSVIDILLDGSQVARVGASSEW